MILPQAPKENQAIWGDGIIICCAIYINYCRVFGPRNHWIILYANLLNLSLLCPRMTHIIPALTNARSPFYGDTMPSHCGQISVKMLDREPRDVIAWGWVIDFVIIGVTKTFSPDRAATFAHLL